ncbi:DUF4345 domain-containing protein [Carboxylicivirga sp. N1Y90]|uniref:DUF4345 domain-containing protein n=1 Tax=Carboxylicivirga fragile TaxID=3417571 RepID=UPI003D357B85|nr:DUF4345 domain-containing protein [Marinilabiliaceae bacterium N1Y90]
MRSINLVRILLFISGLIGLIIGLALTLVPVAFEASAGIDLGHDINLLSEIRAPGGSLLIGGVLIFLGAFISNLRLMSLVLSSVLYLGYGLGRLLSLFLDGMPHQSLFMAFLLELFIGALSLIAIFYLKKK